MIFIYSRSSLAEGTRITYGEQSMRERSLFEDASTETEPSAISPEMAREWKRNFGGSTRIGLLNWHGLNRALVHAASWLRAAEL
jgi:hypothetical protein